MARRARMLACALALAVAAPLLACSSDGATDDPAAADEVAAAGADDGATSFATDARPAIRSPGCEAPTTLEPGDHDGTLVHDGEDRVYEVMVPELDGAAPMPLLLDLHGLGSNAAQQRAVSGYDALGARDGVVVAWPQGLGDRPSWNTRIGSGADDPGFLVALVADLGERLCLDEARTYASGMSNGGLMSSGLGCLHPDVFAAVAPVAGFQLLPDCGEPSPVLAFYGTHDAVLPYAGGVGEALGAVATGEVPPPYEPAEPDLSAPPGPFAPVPVNLAAWAEAAGCDPEPAVEVAGTDVVHRTYQGCRDDVELYLVEGGGHAWPGATGMAEQDDPVIAAVIGTVSMEISATDLAWDFFAAHALDAGS